MRRRVFLLMLVLWEATVSHGQTANALSGAGATFPYPLYARMFSEYGIVSGQVVNYRPVGSGNGIEELRAQKIDFAASDAMLNAAQDSALPAPVVYIPVTAGAVVICYNLPKLDEKIPLKLTPSVLAGIFSGQITHWDDARIKSLNTELKIPSWPIVVVHRSDGSGTTDIFTTYLSAVSTEWNRTVGRGNLVKWPVGSGGKGNDGVAGIIKGTPGAIGYVELVYAKQNHIPFATLKNKSGKYVVANFESTSAAAHISIPADSKVSLVNTAAKNGYPVSGFTWILVYKEQNYNGRDRAAAMALMNLVQWIIKDGQKYCADLHYAPLPKDAIKVARKIIKSVTYDGIPLVQ